MPAAEQSPQATPSVEATPPPASPAPVPSKKDRKAAKKARAKEKDVDELDKVLAELSVKYPDLQTVSTSAASTSRPSLSSLLAVNPAHLDPQSELRKLFGSKVIPPSSKFSARVRSVLVKPKDGWWPAKLREGLSLRSLVVEEVEGKRQRFGWSDGEADEGRWWTVEYDRRYKSVTKGFVGTVMSGDPEGFWRILSKLPYHADTLLQLAEAYRYRDEHAQATDFTERALFAYERAFSGVGSFNFTTGSCRLDFDRVENRPFFLAVARVITDLQRRGCPRTALEFAKLLYSLDPWTDPHGALLHLDTLAVKSGSSAWLLDVYDYFNSKSGKGRDGRMDPSVLPGWMYSRALALRMQENSEKSITHERSDAALKEAILAFPSVVPVLADKGDISLPGEVRAHRAFRVHTGASGTQSEDVAHLLAHLYAQRAGALWKQESAYGSWLSSTASSLLSYLPQSALSNVHLGRFTALFSKPTLAYSVYRHLVVLESSSSAGTAYRTLFAFMPAEVNRGGGLACDPVPPLTRVSEYDETFFEGVGDAFGFEGMSRRARERLVERLVPDPRVRRYLQAVFDANPRLAQQFPGGLVQLAQVAGQMGEDAVEELLAQVAQMDGDGFAEGDGGMPGGMPGEMDLRFLDEAEEGEPHNRGGGGEQEVAQREEGDDDDDDDDDEEGDEEVDVAPMPVRLIRNIMSRFWGGAAAQEEEGESSDEDERHTLPGGDVD
ncbi:DUF654-domain-containing protein [Gloeophyllum trabeum ATCC 11539]|uniref:DUF654-domain-containing protein n=1 Tax=Gloeophyllum trabeum (strain ATCC 11539 / FP-39264 / Madison 617) TaxID=670483 RepID=S7RXX9_GLOTA|nr:DUF654-domain-containing protein [Gloeophyllum trabeum ATCC 11539]EPQ59800.1 DUF654-domain-containing protein [Gloeophyllum trabeum ATCC 11539]